MNIIYNVVKEYLEDESILPTIYAFTDKDEALAFTQQEIDYRNDIYKDEENKQYDYFQWFLYIPWKFDLRLRITDLDMIHASKKAQKHPNCLSK